MPNATTQPSQAAREELKPCPFCGGTADWGYNMTMAFCKSCGATAFWKKWDTRFERDTEKRVRESLTDTAQPSQADREALKPCPNPWCEGHEYGDAGAPTRDDVEQHGRSGEYRVACSSCNMRGPHRPTEAEAITAWNTRFERDTEKRVRESVAGEANVERVALEQARSVALHHSNYGHIEGNKRAFVIVDDIQRRIDALATLERTTDAG